MKTFRLLKHCLSVVAFIGFAVFAQAADKIKVACVGDSITAGAGIHDPAKNAYPAQLQHVLGDKYEVKNFGVSGRTILRKGDNPYWNEKAFQNAKDFGPDIVVVKLGTNDSKPQNMAHKEDLVKDYTDLAQEFQNLPSKPKVYLCLPVYVAKTAWGISEAGVLNSIIPAIEEAAKAAKIEIIDLHTPTYGKSEFFDDGVHPNIEGAGVMAKEVARAIKGERQTSSHPKKNLPGDIGDWFGFKQHKWNFSNSDTTREAIVVEPKFAADGKPWIWRPAFFGHEPQTDIALLNLGYHVVYLDVTNDYGSPKSIKLGEDFHFFLTHEFGFAPRAVMEGLSRGGFYSLRFAAENPDKVAILYLDAPACDIKVWKILGDWKDVLVHWDIPESDPENFKDNPMSHLEGMAKAGVSIISVCGDADKIVPMEEHTGVLEKKYKAIGGNIKVIVKPGVGHHPHSLKDPTPIVDFIIENQPGYGKQK